MSQLLILRKKIKKFDKTYQMYVLRKDDNGDWKIRTFYKIKGNSTEEE